MQFHDQFRDVLLNPTLIVEVLSASTEAFDRVEENRWELVSMEGLEASLHLESIHGTLRLTEVYDRIIFPTEDPELVQDQPAGS